MSTQAALAFFRDLRGRRDFEDCGRYGLGLEGLAPLLSLARELGYDIDEADLRDAFVQDQQLRIRAFFGSTA